MTAREILDVKGRRVYSISADRSVSEAVAELVKHNIGLLIVRDTSGDIAGVLSERDIIRKCDLAGKSLAAVRAGEIMTPKDLIVAADEGDDIQILMYIMTERKVRHLPVFRGRELTGIISIGDVIKNMLEMKDFEIKSLIDYISGKYPA